jgi:hypothetical protein
MSIMSYVQIKVKSRPRLRRELLGWYIVWFLATVLLIVFLIRPDWYVLPWFVKVP